MPDPPRPILTGTTEPPAIPELLLTPRESADLLRKTAADAIRQNPREAARIVDATVRLLASDDPRLMKVHSDAQLRKQGMWLGGGMSIASVMGGVVLLVLGAPAVAGIALLCTGAACAGGTFAVITGARVEPEAFAEMLRAARGEKKSEHGKKEA